MSVAAIAVAGCGGAKQKASANAANGAAATSNASVATAPAPPPAAAPLDNQTRVETIERTNSNGQQIMTKALVGPDVQPPGTRPINADEVAEIERATGRPYEEGDSIYGRSEPKK